MQKWRTSAQPWLALLLRPFNFMDIFTFILTLEVIFHPQNLTYESPTDDNAKNYESDMEMIHGILSYFYSCAKHNSDMICIWYLCAEMSFGNCRFLTEFDTKEMSAQLFIIAFAYIKLVKRKYFLCY